MGLNPHRDRLCLVQLSAGDGDAHLVQLVPPALGGRGFDCPNLARLLADPGRGQADALRPLRRGRAAARARHHGGAGALHQDRRQAGPHLHRPARAEDLCRELLGVELSKQQQSSDWGAPELTAGATRLRRLRRAAPARALGQAGSVAAREDRLALAEACFAFLPARGSILTRHSTAWPMRIVRQRRSAIR